MKKLLIICSLLTLILSGCASNGISSNEAPEAEPIPDAIKDLTETKPSLEKAKTYTLFTLNVHDWVHPENSAETVNKVIDIHEEHNVPVDIYLTDPVLQNYIEDYPELIERLKTSEVVAVSYHVRPSTPYYANFDHIGLEEMNDEDAYETVKAYEEHKLDLETGNYFENEPGGYQLLADTIGYAPLAVGVAVERSIGETLAQVFIDKGAKFLIQHGTRIDLGDTLYGSYVRPEHKEVKLYELVRDYTGGQDVFDMATEELTERVPEFINMKYHENNFYLTDTPFWPTYWTDVKKSEALEPPYDVSASITDGPGYRTPTMQEAHWALYEETVRFTNIHSYDFNPINAFDLVEMLD
jgi:hypothetical protein